MSRPKHPQASVEAAIRYAEAHGWEYLRKGGGHAWGILSYEQGPMRGNCRVSVWSTPRSPENHARQIRREVDRCAH